MTEFNGTPPNRFVFPFRPWVRRAGLTILAVSLGASLVVLIALRLPAFRYGWAREPFALAYIAVLWIGGARVFFGTFQPVVEIDGDAMIVRPLHQLRARRIPFGRLEGTEQTIGGDRLIVYYQTARGLRFVALNLNLVRGRRELERLLSDRLEAAGFEEKFVEDSRYLTRHGRPGDEREAGHRTAT